MKENPKRRKDGRCYVCRKPMKMAKPQRGVNRQHYESDPFCSAVCARRYHGVSLRGDPLDSNGQRTDETKEVEA